MSDADLQPFLKKPERSRLLLRLEPNRTFDVGEFDVADFTEKVLKTRRKKADKQQEGGETSKKGDDFSLVPIPLSAFPAEGAKHRGVIFYHGGSADACASTSFAEAEGGAKVIVLVPRDEAAFRAQVGQCAEAFQKAQRWGYRDKVWKVLPGGKANFALLSPKEQGEIEAQLRHRNERMLFVPYEELECRQYLKGDGNPLDGAVVVVEQIAKLAHLVVGAAAGSQHALLYEWLLSAVDCKVVGLSSGPTFEEPLELGVAYNMVYGYTPVWTVKTEVEEVPEALRPWVWSTVPLEGGATLFVRTPKGYRMDAEKKQLAAAVEAPDDAAFGRELAAAFQGVSTVASRRKLFPDRGKWTVSDEELGVKIGPLTRSAVKSFRPLAEHRVHTVQMSEYQEVVYNQVLEEGAADLARAVCNFAYPQGVPRPKLGSMDLPPLPTLIKEKVFHSLRTKFSPKMADVLKTVRTALVHHADRQQLVVCPDRADAVLLAEAFGSNGFVRWPDAEANLVLAPIKFDDLREALEAFNKSDSALRVFVGTEDVPLLPNVADVHFLQPPAFIGDTEEVLAKVKRGVALHIYVSRQHRDAPTMDEEAMKTLTRKRDMVFKWAKI